MTSTSRRQKIGWTSVVAVFLSLAAAISSGCQREVWDSNPNHELRFSSDTLFFDTVFTTVGSVTLPLKVYNDHEGSLLIDEIELVSGVASQYRINVDGAPITNLSQPYRDKVLHAGDSMYVFVEVTVDPDQSAGDSPFWVIESLRFLTNGNEQEVTLVARGQNARFYGDPDEIAIDICDEVWSSDLPYVVYGRLRVPEGCTLTIDPGTNIYAHSGSGIWVDGGTLIADGELDSPITFQGDRLDDAYAGAVGQWGISVDLTLPTDESLINYSVFRGGIWMSYARDCRLDHVHLAQATVGLWVDSVAAGAEYALKITNSTVTLAESIGILSQSGHIVGYNNLFSDCGQACGYFALGGDIQMHLSTFANFASGSGGIRQFPTLYLNDWYEAADGSLQLRPFSNNSEWRNCIAYGNNAGLTDFSEVVVDLFDAEAYSTPLITASAIHHQEPTFPEWIYDEQTTVNQVPPFVNPFGGDFAIDGTSTLWNGISSIPPFDVFEVGTDLNGMPRNTSTPTKGCLERIP